MTSDTHTTPDPDAAFRARAERIAQFREDHDGAFPRTRSTDHTERVLGGWISNLRTSSRGKIGKGPNLTDSRRQILDEVLPGWDAVRPGNLPDEELFADRIRAAAAYKQEHGRYPSSGPNDETGLGAFLMRVRTASNGHGNLAWNKERQKLVRTLLPGWLEGPSGR